MKFTVQKEHHDIPFNVELELNGGVSDASEMTLVCGGTYEFPIVTKEGYILEDWYADPDFQHRIAKTDKADYNIKKLYAKWLEFTNCTTFEVTTTSSYKTFGFYAATKKSTSSQIFIDWGDGEVQKVTSISQLYHTYSTVGTFTVRVSDDITTLTVSYNSSTYYQKIQYTLKKVLTWSTSITTLPNYCFYYAQALNSVTANLSHVTSLGSYCFYYCNTLASFEFVRAMTKLTQIQSYCFYYCTYFTDLSVIPSSVTTFGTYCFYQCRITDLSRIRSTDTLNSYCFGYNTTLTSLSTFKPRSTFPTYLFAGCSGLKQAHLSAFTSLTALNTYCFYSCTQLTSVQLPSSIRNISDYAFYSCTQLKNTDFLSGLSQLTSIGGSAFRSCTALSSISLPSKVQSIGTYAFYYNYASGLKNLNLSGLTSLTTIGTYAFQYCYNLTAMSLPSSLTSIGNYAFTGCYNLNQISCYRDTAPTVGAYTFGSSTAIGTTSYVGYNKRSTGTNTLYVNVPNNYKTSYWSSVLLDSSKSNFKVMSLDPYDADGFTVSGIESRYVYTGEQIAPVATIKNSAGQVLTAGTHYTIAYSNNIECGTAQITITGLSPYHGTKTISFTIYDPSKQTMTVNLNSQWRVPVQWTNSNASFDVYESYSNYNKDNQYAKMYIEVDGYTDLTLYINSYAESNYDYTVAFTEDYDPTSNAGWTAVGTNVKATTYGYQYNPSSYGITSGTGWKAAKYTLDGGKHKICICYRKDSSASSGWDRGYVAIPKI